MEKMSEKKQAGVEDFFIWLYKYDKPKRNFGHFGL